MRADWRCTTLGQELDFLSGGTPAKDAPDYWAGSIPWVSAKDMKRFSLEDTIDHITERAVSDGIKVVPAGTVLMLVRGMTLLNDLPICTVRRSMAFNQDVKALRSRGGFEEGFLHYLLLANKRRMLSMVDLAGHGTGRLNTDPVTDSDKLDLFFSPFDTLDFYKALDLRIREGDFSVSATEMGEGIQNALVLAILKAFEERRKQGAILLIEEPEMFLHPQMQRSLYRTLREISETNQVIYTTHSPHFVSVPDYHEVLVVRKSVADGTKVRSSSLATNPQRREKLRKELDPERNELFFASRLLLVEGDTEKLALPVYAMRLGLDIDRSGGTIVEVGGKRNLLEFARMAESFEISTGIVYDLDSSDISGHQEEAQLNSELDALEREDGVVRVWRFRRKYEDHLRQAFGEPEYMKRCGRYANMSKAIRARLIASEEDGPIPEPIPSILAWLANASVLTQ